MGGVANMYERLEYKDIDPLIFNPYSLAYIKGSTKTFEEYQKQFSVKDGYSRRCPKNRQPAVLKDTEENRNILKKNIINIDKSDKPASYLNVNDNIYFCPRFWCASTGKIISLNDVKVDPENNRKWISDKCNGPLLDGHNVDGLNKKRTAVTGRHIGILSKEHDFNNNKVVKCGDQYYATEQDAIDDMQCDNNNIEKDIPQICVPCCFKSHQTNIKCNNGKQYNENIELKKSKENVDEVEEIDKNKLYDKEYLKQIDNNKKFIIYDQNDNQINENIYTKLNMESEIEFDKFKIYNIEEEYSFFYKNDRASDKINVHLLSKNISKILNSDEYNNKNIEYQKKIKNNNNEFYGLLPKINYNLIGILMIALNIENKNRIYYTYDLLKKIILENITEETFDVYYNTNLKFIFETYIKFKKYLQNKSDINKEYDDIIIEYLLNKEIIYYINNTSTIEKNKLNIIILEEDDNIYMTCPNYSSKYNNKIKTLILIKKIDKYNILIKNGKTFHNHLDVKDIINSFKDCIIRKNNLKYKEYITINYDDLQKEKKVITRPRILLDEINTNYIKEYIYDNLNKIIGIINNDGIIIPIQPADNIINISKDKLINIKDIKKYYKSIEETYNNYNKIKDLQVSPKSIAVINDNVIGIRLENGYTVGINPIIKLSEYKKLNIPLIETNVQYYNKSKDAKKDNRINKINKIEYEEEIYKRVELELANYLNNNINEKENIKKILEDNELELKEKREKIYNILKIIIVKISYQSSNIDLTNYVKPEIRESCIRKMKINVMKINIVNLKIMNVN